MEMQERMTECEKFLQERVYLPANNNRINVKEYLNRYIEKEFPTTSDGNPPAVYSVPRTFTKFDSGKRQANLAEEKVFQRLLGLGDNKSTDQSNLWVTFFHSACYAGHSFRNLRVGRLMIREHDFVVFAKFKGSFYMALLEVKSTNDANTKKDNIEKTSDSKVIKNNKRSAQHQLRDHMEVLQRELDINLQETQIQCYIMWPFLGAYTKSPNQEKIKRWKEDINLHVFEDKITDQESFNDWFLNIVINGNQCIDEKHFYILLNRYVVLSCGVFVDEIHKGMLALLTQEQLQLLNNDICRREGGGPLIVHGAAGTGKTLLVLKKLQQLHQSGQLNEENRALYICYWPGIRLDFQLRLRKLGLEPYVDTIRFYISLDEFMRNNTKKYKHVFMDEAEALCLAFSSEICSKTFSSIYNCYHEGNCTVPNCTNTSLGPNRDFSIALKNHQTKNWGEIWFMVDINQASLFLPKHSPQMLKKPSFVLNKVMRCTVYIFNFFKQFYNKPMPKLPVSLLANMNIPNIKNGHNIRGPPVYWVSTENSNDLVTAKVIIDLCSTKGFKPNDICVLPFLVNEKMIPESINKHIGDYFVENSYRPKAIGDVECFLRNAELTDFLITWALRVKGLEFKVVIMVIENEDFDNCDAEDRKKIYIMASRCTCMLILVSNVWVRDHLELESYEDYPFHLNFDVKTESRE